MKIILPASQADIQIDINFFKYRLSKQFRPYTWIYRHILCIQMISNQTWNLLDMACMQTKTLCYKQSFLHRLQVDFWWCDDVLLYIHHLIVWNCHITSEILFGTYFLFCKVQIWLLMYDSSFWNDVQTVNKNVHEIIKNTCSNSFAIDVNLM